MQKGAVSAQAQTEPTKLERSGSGEEMDAPGPIQTNILGVVMPGFRLAYRALRVSNHIAELSIVTKLCLA